MLADRYNEVAQQQLACAAALRGAKARSLSRPAHEHLDHNKRTCSAHAARTQRARSAYAAHAGAYATVCSAGFVCSAGGGAPRPLARRRWCGAATGRRGAWWRPQPRRHRVSVEPMGPKWVNCTLGGRSYVLQLPARRLPEAPGRHEWRSKASKARRALGPHGSRAGR